MASSNPFALVVLTAKTVLKGRQIKDSKQRDQLYMDTKLALIRQLLQKNHSKIKIRRVMNFIKFYINFDSSEINIKFEKELNILTENKSTMGLEELLLEWAENKGIEEGKILGKEQLREEFVYSLIVKFNMSDEQICNSFPVELNFVKKEREKLKIN